MWIINKTATGKGPWDSQSAAHGYRYAESKLSNVHLGKQSEDWGSDFWFGHNNAISV